MDDVKKDGGDETKQMEEFDTQPFSRISFSLQEVMEAYRLNLVALAQEAAVPSMTLWRTMRGLPVTTAHAQAIVRAIWQVTGTNVSGDILTVEHQEVSRGKK
jgi:predicted transcriptional regulator